MSPWFNSSAKVARSSGVRLAVNFSSRDRTCEGEASKSAPDSAPPAPAMCRFSAETAGEFDSCRAYLMVMSRVAPGCRGLKSPDISGALCFSSALLTTPGGS